MRGNQSVAGQCVGKFRFESPQDAHRVAAKERRKKRRPIQSYRCDCCRGWHVGTPKRRIRHD